MKKNRAVIYARLSREDEDKIDGNKESRSIENQIEGLSIYADEHELDVVNVYYDDGYSGGNLNRPGIQNLLKDMKLKKFDIVLVKDISRLGRSLHRVGELIENTFPENHIRVISVNDKYDSQTYNNSESIVLRNFLNDYYLKEFKKKMKQVRERDAHKKHLCFTQKYGYIFDDKRQESIDEYASKIVKKLFELVAYEKKSLAEIARWLNESNIQTRSEYIQKTLGKKGTTKNPSKIWIGNMVREIVTDYEYCGHSINWSCHKKEEQILIKNTHKAIITEDLFEKAQEVLNSRSWIVKHGYIRPNHIGRLISDKVCESKHYCFSSHYENRKNAYYFSRYSGYKIHAITLENILYADIQELIKECMEKPDKLYNIYKRKIFDGKDYSKEKIEESLKEENEKYSIMIEDYYNRVITEIEFNKKSKILIEKIHSLENELNQCTNRQVEANLFEIKFKQFLEDIKYLPDKMIDLIKVAVGKVIITNYVDRYHYDITIKYKFEI